MIKVTVRDINPKIEETDVYEDIIKTVYDKDLSLKLYHADGHITLIEDLAIDLFDSEVTSNNWEVCGLCDEEVSSEDRVVWNNDKVVCYECDHDATEQERN